MPIWWAKNNLSVLICSCLITHTVEHLFHVSWPWKLQPPHVKEFRGGDLVGKRGEVLSWSWAYTRAENVNCPDQRVEGRWMAFSSGLNPSSTQAIPWPQHYLMSFSISSSGNYLFILFAHLFDCVSFLIDLLLAHVYKKNPLLSFMSYVLFFLGCHSSQCCHR